MSVLERGASRAQFASRLAVAWLADDPDRRHRRLDGTLVSADLSGFTAMSERFAARGKEGAERLTLAVNGCFTALIDAAAREGGDVLKFGGDALLLWFDGDGHEQRGARGAARMQRAIGAPRFARAGLRMSVGVHAGPVDLYLVGRPDWRELVLAGPPVTCTVELEAAAGAGQVLLSRSLAAQLPAGWRGPDTADGVLLAIDAVPLPRRAIPPAAEPAVDISALVPPELRDDVDALAATGGEHRMATTAFAELHGTDAAIAADGAAFTAGVDALVQAAQEQSTRFGTQFLYTDVVADGIKLILTAGAPHATDDDEEAGLRTALALVGGDPRGRLRAGVHRGRVFAGFLGSTSRRTYTVMGDPVNLAARLMGKAEPGQVVASTEVLDASRAVFDRTDLDPFLVKGKAEPIRAAVVGPDTGARRVRRSTGVPLIGRDHELAELRRAIGRAVAGSGEVVELVGDAGIGKTRLLQSVADDPRVLVRIATECQPYDALSPYASARPLLRRALGIPAEASPAAAGTMLTAVVARVAPASSSLLPLLALPIGADVDDTPEASAIAEEFRVARMHEAVVDLLAAALPTSTLLVVEDVYYVDDASLQLIHAIARAVPDRPWALLVTRRPEGAGVVVGVVPGTVMKLQPLEGDAALRLAEAATGAHLVDAVDLGVVVGRSGGNPLFVLQLVDAAGAGVAADDLPESIERLVATRVDRLAPADRALLRQAAVIGRVFHTSLLNTLLAAEGAPRIAPDRWAALGDLVEPDGDRTWRFRHALFRDVAYEGLPFARRKRMHAAVGELLEAGVAGIPDPALLSQHFWLAGDAERTWRYSVATGDAAWESYAVAEAIGAYERALAVRRRVPELEPLAVGEVAERLGDVLERAARYEEAARAYGIARRADSPPPSPRTARLLRKVGVLRERQGRYDQALRWWTRGLRLLEGDESAAAIRERAALELSCGGVRHRQGDHAELHLRAARAEALARSIGDRFLEAYALNQQQLAITYGVGHRGTAQGQRALELFRLLGEVQHEGKALNNLGIEAFYRGRWDEAAARYREAYEVFRRAGDLMQSSTALQNLGEISCDQGRLQDAQQQFQEALPQFRRAGYGIGIPVVQMNLGRTLARAGRFDESEVLLADAAEGFAAVGARSYTADVLSWEAERHLLGGGWRRALADLQRLEDQHADAALHPDTRARWWRIRGWAGVQADDVEVARGVLLDGLSRAVELGVPFEELLVLAGLVEVGTRLDDGRVEGWRARVEALTARLGVQHLPAVPLPG